MRRFRRLRSSESMRRMVRETRISPEEMIYPVFVIEGENIKNPIDSMPGVYQYSIDRLAELLAEVKQSGISGVLIFGIPAEKDAVGSQAYHPDGITQRAIREIKKYDPELLVIADVCLCEYT
ncbi:MAG: porphobilinogen synthase, partial [Bacillota bacterium]|nr:porphobilinogen synthase [Bacillota bacterium]